MQKKAETSWGGVAEWYQQLLSAEGTYQKEVILPNLLRLLEIKKGEVVLDLACGPGFFTNEFYKQGAKTIGADIASELIKIAKKNSPQDIKYFVSSADKFSFFCLIICVFASTYPKRLIKFMQKCNPIPHEILLA